jgi:hypothetical protein
MKGLFMVQIQRTPIPSEAGFFTSSDPELLQYRLREPQQTQQLESLYPRISQIIQRLQQGDYSKDYQPIGNEAWRNFQQRDYPMLRSTLSYGGANRNSSGLEEGLRRAGEDFESQNAMNAAMYGNQRHQQEVQELLSLLGYTQQPYNESAILPGEDSTLKGLGKAAASGVGRAIGGSDWFSSLLGGVKDYLTDYMGGGRQPIAPIGQSSYGQQAIQDNRLPTPQGQMPLRWDVQRSKPDQQMNQSWQNLASALQGFGTGSVLGSGIGTGLNQRLRS